MALFKKPARKPVPAPHTASEYSAAAHTAYRMKNEGCSRAEIRQATGIPDAQVIKLLTTNAGKALVAGVLEGAKRKVDLEKIKSIQTGESGPEKFAEALKTGRVKLRLSQEQLDDIVKEHVQRSLQGRK